MVVAALVIGYLLIAGYMMLLINSLPFFAFRIAHRASPDLRRLFGARHFALNFSCREATALADMFSGTGPQKGAARFTTGRATGCRLDETIARRNVVFAIGRVVDAGGGGRNAAHSCWLYATASP